MRVLQPNVSSAPSRSSFGTRSVLESSPRQLPVQGQVFHSHTGYSKSVILLLYAWRADTTILNVAT